MSLVFGFAFEMKLDQVFGFDLVSDFVLVLFVLGYLSFPLVEVEFSDPACFVLVPAYSALVLVRFALVPACFVLVLEHSGDSVLVSKQADLAFAPVLEYYSDRAHSDPVLAQVSFDFALTAEFVIEYYSDRAYSDPVLLAALVPDYYSELVLVPAFVVDYYSDQGGLVVKGSVFVLVLDCFVPVG